MNDAPDEGLEVIEPVNFNEEVKRYLAPADQLAEDVSKHEREMNQMFLELNDLQDMIKGNKDLKEMESKYLLGTNLILTSGILFLKK